MNQLSSQQSDKNLETKHSTTLEKEPTVILAKEPNNVPQSIIY